MGKNRLVLIAVLFACLLFVPLLWGTAQTHAQAPSPYWSHPATDIPPSFDLTSVYLLNGTDDAWVAGYDTSGMVWRLHRQGDRWVIVQQQAFSSPIRALVAIADDNVWAVGDKGLILHRDRAGWHQIPSPVPGATLTTIQMFGQGQEGWAGGYVPTSPGSLNGDAVLLHYLNSAWQQTTLTSGQGGIAALHFAGNVGYAVGPQPAGYRYSNGAWQPETLPCVVVRFYCSTSFAAVRAVSPDDAWAVGTVEAEILSSYAIAHRSNGQWADVTPRDALVGDTFGQTRQRSGLLGLSFSDATHGFAVGWQHNQWTSPNYPFIISYQPDGRWHYENIPFSEGVMLNAVSHADAMHALAVGTNGTLLAYGYSGSTPAPWPTATPVPPGPPTPTPIPWPPTQRVPDPHLPNVLYFPVVGHSLQGGFRAYWEAHGGLAQFGYPLTEEFWTTPPGSLGPNFTTQYFERARFEWHPENRPPYDVLLGLLGRELTVTRQNETPFQPHPAQPSSTGIYFPETQHNLAPEFVAYWQSHGGLPVYGYPISEPFSETSATDGKPYLVQYFERNRFEYHPELPDAYRVSLGLLGVDQLRGLGWVP